MKTIDEVRILKRDLVNFYQVKHTRQRKAWDFYNGHFHVLTRKQRGTHQFHEVLTNDARIIVDNIAGIIHPTSFQVKFEPLKPTEDEKARADQLEELVYALLHRWGTLKSQSPFSEAVKNVAIYGETAVRTLYDEQSWGTKPVRQKAQDKEEYDYQVSLWNAQRQTRLPIRVNAVDPLNMLPAPGQDHPDFMIEVYKLKPYQLKKDFPDWLNPTGDDFKPVQLITYFDSDTWMYLVGDDSQATNLPRNPANPYGICPYTMAWSGLGKNSPDGLPEDKAVGLIYPIIPAIEERSRSLTAVSIILQATALPRGYTRRAPAGSLPLGLVAPGEFLEIGETEFGYFETKPASPDLYRLVDIAGQQIEEYLSGRILGGQRPTGVTSALMYEILQFQSGLKYQSFIEGMEALYAGVVANALYLIERFVGDPLPGIKIKPQNIKGYYQPQMKFVYEDIATKRIKAMIGRMLFMSGLLDFETVHEDYLGTANVSKVRKGIIKDHIFKDPSILSALAIEAIEEMGLTGALERVAKQQYEGRRIEGLSGEEQRRLEEMIGKPAGIGAEGLTEPFTGGGYGYSEGFAGERVASEER